MRSVNKLLAIASRTAAVLFAFMLTAAITRTMPQQDAGRYFLITSTVTLLATVGRIGTDIALLKVTASREMPGGSEFRRLFRIGLVGSAGASVVGVGVLVLLLRPSEMAQLPVLIVASSAILAQAVSVMIGAVLRAVGLIATGAFAELGSTPLLAICGVTAVYFSGRESLDAILLIYSGASWLTLLWSTAAILVVGTRHRRDTSRTRPADPLATPLVSLLSMMGTTVAVFATGWAPLVVLNASSGPESVAMFNAAAKLAAFIAVFPAIQQSYLGPQFALMFARRNTTELSRVAGRTSLTALVIASVPAIALLFAPEAILQAVMGPGYGSASSVLIVLSVGALATVGLGQTSLLLLLVGEERFAAAANIAVVIAWFTLGWGAGTYGGALGIAVLSATLMIAFSVVGTVLLIRRASVTPLAMWRSQAVVDSD